jgi:hypothetical protein
VAIAETGTSGVADKTLATTVALGTRTEVTGAGFLIVVGGTADNLTASTPTLSLNKPAGETNSWTVVQANSPVATAAGGVLTYLAYILSTTSWAATAITATWSGSVQARAGSIKTFTGATVTTRAAATTGTLAGSLQTASPTSPAGTQVGDLVLLAGASEQPADGTTPDWTSAGETVTSQQKTGTTGGSGVTNCTVSLAYATPGTAGARTYTISQVTDGGYILLALAAAAAAAPALPIIVQPPRR